MLERVAGMLDDVCVTFFVRMMFDRNQNILPTKNVRQKSSNMSATYVLILLDQQMLFNIVRTCKEVICKKPKHTKHYQTLYFLTCT